MNAFLSIGFVFIDLCKTGSSKGNNNALDSYSITLLQRKNRFSQGIILCKIALLKKEYSKIEVNSNEENGNKQHQKDNDAKNIK